MIKKLLGGVLGSLNNPEGDRKNVEFLLGEIKDDKLWQLRTAYDDILFRIRIYRRVVEIGATGVDYKKFAGGGEYFRDVLKAVSRRYSGKASDDIEKGLSLAEKGEREAAAKFFRSAADLFQPEGCFYYGLSRLESDDAMQAAECFRTAAILGHAPSLYNLALCYFYGSGVPVCVPKCLRLLAMALLRNVEQATALLAEMYKHGDGIDTDFARAFALTKGTKEQKEEVARQIIAETDL